MKFTSILTLFSLGALVLGFAGCDSSTSDDLSGTVGPSNSASFVGSSIAFNPTIEFEAGDNMTYTNTGTNSPFPVSPTPATGTYNYTPNADYTQGVLTLTVLGETIELDIYNFVIVNSNITGFTARYDGESYPVLVTGSLPPHGTGNNGGGENPDETRATDLPSSVQGSHALVFFSGTDITPDLPAEGETTTFTIGARTLTFDGRTLSDPVFYGGDESEWLFKDDLLTYGVSTSGSGVLKEINVYGPIGSTGPSGSFGQYRAVEDVDETAGRPSSGSYTGTVESANVPSGFPELDRYEEGDTETFVFGNDTVTVNGVTYSYRRTDTGAGSDTEVLVYDTPVGAGPNTDVVRVLVSSIGTTRVIEGFEIDRTRDAVAPATGSLTAEFVFGLAGD